MSQLPGDGKEDIVWTDDFFIKFIDATKDSNLRKFRVFLEERSDGEVEFLLRMYEQCFKYSDEFTRMCQSYTYTEYIRRMQLGGE